MAQRTRQGIDLGVGSHATFLHLLVNTLFVSVINFTVWFAITFGSISRPNPSSRPAWWPGSSSQPPP
jgi:hypothetical protein